MWRPSPVRLTRCRPDSPLIRTGASRVCEYGTIRPGNQAGTGSPCRRAPCFIAAPVSLKRSKSSSTRKSISCACAGIAKRAAIRCGYRLRRAMWCSPCRRAARCGKPVTSRGSMAAGSQPGCAACRRRRRSPGTVLPLRGAPHRVMHRRLARGTVWTEVGSDGEQLMCVAGDPPHIERRIRDFLHREAKRDLEAAAQAYADKLGVTLKRISIRDQNRPLGVLFDHGRALLLVAAHPCAAFRARLSRRARSGASHRNEPFGPLLAAASSHLPGCAAREGLARRLNGADLHRYGILFDDVGYLSRQPAAVNGGASVAVSEVRTFAASPTCGLLNSKPR